MILAGAKVEAGMMAEWIRTADGIYEGQCAGCEEFVNVCLIDGGKLLVTNDVKKNQDFASLPNWELKPELGTKNLLSCEIIGGMDKVFALIKDEEKRQRETLMLIPSENYASKEVRSAQCSVLNNKYSEGYPQKRYYQGNKYIDAVEQIAIDRAKKLFGVEFVNVQPYSGSPANAAVLMALCQPGDTIMGMKLSGGGHLTHGHPHITFSGKFFNSIQYDVDENGIIDYEEVAKLAELHKPKVMIIGTTAYPRILDFKRFSEIAKKVGAFVLADTSHIAGLVVGSMHPSPVPFADIVMTTTHKTLRGPRGAILMTNNPEIAKKVDRAVFPGLQGGPHNATTAAIAVALGEAQGKPFRKYAQQIVKNAQVLAEELKRLGLTLTTGGTDNHLMVVDLRPQNIGGKEIAVRLEEVGIIVNCNTVPHDTNPPANPSGIRLGTPAVTTRGMKENEMKVIAGWINEVVEYTRSKVQDSRFNNIGSDDREKDQVTRKRFKQEMAKDKTLLKIAASVKSLCRKFPTP